MSSGEIRKTTKYSFNIGYLLIGYSLIAISYGMHFGFVTKENFVAILTSLLATGAAFFGINVLRVTQENVETIKTAGNVQSTAPSTESTVVSAPSGTVQISQSTGIDTPAIDPSQLGYPVGEFYNENTNSR